jgi:hypothetical protein
MTAGKPTQAEALSAIAAEMRTANMLEVLKLGTSALDHADTSKTVSPETVRRQTRMNRVRAEIRAALGIEVSS